MKANIEEKRENKGYKAKDSVYRKAMQTCEKRKTNLAGEIEKFVEVLAGGGIVTYVHKHSKKKTVYN